MIGYFKKFRAESQVYQTKTILQRPIKYVLFVQNIFNVNMCCENKLND